MNKNKRKKYIFDESQNMEAFRILTLLATELELREKYILMFDHGNLIEQWLRKTDFSEIDKEEFFPPIQDINGILKFLKDNLYPSLRYDQGFKECVPEMFRKHLIPYAAEDEGVDGGTFAGEESGAEDGRADFEDDPPTLTFADPEKEREVTKDQVYSAISTSLNAIEKMENFEIILLQKYVATHDPDNGDWKKRFFLAAYYFAIWTFSMPVKNNMQQFKAMKETLDKLAAAELDKEVAENQARKLMASLEELIKKVASHVEQANDQIEAIEKTKDFLQSLTASK